MPAPGELHGHKCGWSPTDNPDMHGHGCGHIFVHRAPTGPVADEDYDQGHCCPRCKAGPWKNVWFLGVEEEWNSMSSEEQQDLQELARIKRQKAALFEKLFTLIFVGDDDGEQEIRETDRI